MNRKTDMKTEDKTSFSSQGFYVQCLSLPRGNSTLKVINEGDVNSL